MSAAIGKTSRLFLEQYPVYSVVTRCQTTLSDIRMSGASDLTAKARFAFGMVHITERFCHTSNSTIVFGVGERTAEGRQPRTSELLFVA
jgi:hypothetical protein